MSKKTCEMYLVEIMKIIVQNGAKLKGFLQSFGECPKILNLLYLYVK